MRKAVSIIVFVVGFVILLANSRGFFGSEAREAPTGSQTQTVTNNEHLAGVTVADITGSQKIVVLRVRFNDYPETSRFTQEEVQSLFDKEINTLWQNNSYGNISISATVSPLLELPENRSDYVTDYSDGDLSEDGQYMKVLLDSVEVANDNGIDFTGAAAVMVLMAETDRDQFHRGQGSKCNLPIGPDGSSPLIGCAIISENPSEESPKYWGRWSHEIGHALQGEGPAHPSNYNSMFELMDALYPGQVGMFSKQEGMGFPGWTPPGKYQTISPGSGGGSAVITAEELAPGSVVEQQAIKVETGTPSLYYMVSVRRKLNGDEVLPIPDEGVLIERVVVGGNSAINDCPKDDSPCPRWVEVKGKGGSRNTLWKVGDTYSNTSDGVFIHVVQRLDANTWLIQVGYGDTDQPDVMIRPWLSPPLHRYETTDIWVDSSCNGYGTYQYGTLFPAGDDTSVGRGNGDNPCANNENRLYARVRNIGGSTATDVKVHFDAHEPLGMGMNGEVGWTLIGSVDSSDFPGLAAIAPGDYVDVYVTWTPAVPPEKLSEPGNFNFHSCVRVRIDPVEGEMITTNQDGMSPNQERENIDQTYVAPSPGGAGSPIRRTIQLHNESASRAKTFNLFWDSELPSAWTLIVNENNPVVSIPPGGVKEIPVVIIPNGPRTVGQIHNVHIAADSLKLLVNDLDPTDVHPVYEELSGVTLEFRVADPSSIRVSSQHQGQVIRVTGHLTSPQRHHKPIFIELLDTRGHALTRQLVLTDQDGGFATQFNGNENARFASASFVGEEFIQGAYSRAVIQEGLPDITLAPKSVAFDNQCVNTQSASRTVTVRNDGNARLTVSSISLAGSHAGDFVLRELPNLPMIVSPGSNFTFGVAFRPGSVGVKSAELRIVNSDPDENPARVSLSGRGMAQDILVSQPFYNFGMAAFPHTGAPDPTQTFTVKNTGACALTVTSISLIGANRGDFILSDLPILPKTVTSGGNLTFNVKFRPTAAGARLATLRISSNDPDERTVNVRLSGTGASISVTSPNGWENWTAGSAHTITWRSAGLIGAVRIKLSTDGGRNYNTVITDSARNDGSYAWVIPSTLSSSDCRIRIESVSNSAISDSSNSDFTISTIPRITIR
jgi:hypothetical protein